MAGNTLYARIAGNEDGRLLAVDLRSGRVRDLIMSRELSVFDLVDAGNGSIYVLADKGVWRLTPSSGLLSKVPGLTDDGDHEDVSGEGVIAVARDSRGNFYVNRANGRTIRKIDALNNLATEIVPQFPAPLSSEDVRIVGITIENDALYASARSEMADGLWEIDPSSGRATSVVGPNTKLGHDPMYESRTWRGRGFRNLTTDHHGGLLFVMGYSARVMRFDLASNQLSYLITPEFGTSTTFKARIRASDIATDSAGDVYIADGNARAVYRVERESGRTRKIASMSGPSHSAFLDAQWSPPDPLTLVCGRDADAPGSVVIEVVDATGAVIPGARVVRIDNETFISRTADEKGIAIFPVDHGGAWSVVATLPGFRSQVLDLGVRRGCVSTERIGLQVDIH